MERKRKEGRRYGGGGRERDVEGEGGGVRERGGGRERDVEGEEGGVRERESDP